MSSIKASAAVLALADRMLLTRAYRVGREAFLKRGMFFQTQLAQFGKMAEHSDVLAKSNHGDCSELQTGDGSRLLRVSRHGRAIGRCGASR